MYRKCLAIVAAGESRYLELLAGQGRKCVHPFEVVPAPDFQQDVSTWTAELVAAMTQTQALVIVVGPNTNLQTDQFVVGIEVARDREVPVLCLWASRRDPQQANSSPPKVFPGIEVAPWTWARVERFARSMTQ